MELFKLEYHPKPYLLAVPHADLDAMEDTHQLLSHTGKAREFQLEDSMEIPKLANLTSFLHANITDKDQENHALLLLIPQNAKRLAKMDIQRPSLRI